MEEKSRGIPLTMLAILFALGGIMDIQKPFGSANWAGLRIGLVFFGKRLTGAPETVLGPLLGTSLLVYAAGICRMRRYALGFGCAYATYVTVNVVLFTMRNPAPHSQSERVFGIVYIILALAFTWGTVILLRRRKAELT